MKSLDYTLDKLPGEQLEIPYAKLPLSSPEPILQQTKSDITTNPFIIPSDKYNKFAVFDGVMPGVASILTSGNTLTTNNTPIATLTPAPVSTPIPVNKPVSAPAPVSVPVPTPVSAPVSVPMSTPVSVPVPTPENPSFSKITQKISTTFIGILDDIYKKPDDVSWFEYLKEILSKDDRFHYVAILIFFIALYIMLVK